MNRDALWAQYVAKNPQFAGEGNITLSAKGLKKLFEQTWALAHDQGLANGKALEALRRPVQASRGTSSLFKGVFG